MLGAANVTARVVGHEEKPYGSFTDSKTGEVKPGGVTHWVTLAAPSTGETLRCKTKPELAERLQPAWWGGEVTVQLRQFAQANRITHSIVEVIAVQPPLPGVLDDAELAKK